MTMFSTLDDTASVAGDVTIATAIKPWAALADLLACVPLPVESKRALVSMMSDGPRHYHGLGHLATLWERHRLHAATATFDIATQEMRIACAIAFHDCVYVGGRKDNEMLSADTWIEASRESSIGEEDRRWVADTIRATADHLAYPTRGDRLALDDPEAEAARLWMLDLDLTPIGEPPHDFDRNTHLLRLEVPHLSEADYDRGRLGFLRHIAAAPRIYRSPGLAAVYEATARANIARQFV